MIRANLLPRRRERLRFGPVDLETGTALALMVSILALATIFVIASLVENARAHALEERVNESEARVAEGAVARDAYRRLALDVVRYDDVARRARAERASGLRVALAVAGIGNALPRHVWLDELVRTDDGYALRGGATSVAALSEALRGLARAFPATSSLGSVDVRAPDRLAFSAHVSLARRQDLP